MASILPTPVLIAILFIIFILFMGYSAVLMYHWFKYAMSTSVALSASVVYMGLGFGLLFIMTTALSSLL